MAPTMERRPVPPGGGHRGSFSARALVPRTAEGSRGGLTRANLMRFPRLASHAPRAAYVRPVSRAVDWGSRFASTVGRGWMGPSPSAEDLRRETGPLKQAMRELKSRGALAEAELWSPGESVGRQLITRTSRLPPSRTRLRQMEVSLLIALPL